MRHICFLLTLLLNATWLFAQDDPCQRKTEGTDFMFGFMESRNYHNGHFVEITVTAREATSFRIFTGKEETP